MNKSEKYEQLTKTIAQEISNHSQNLAGADITQGTKNKIEGNSGYMHQIDVAINTQKR